jgi:hypothetical protein
LDYTNTHIVVNSFTFNDDGEEISLEKGSLWELYDKYCEGKPDEEWVLYDGTRRIVVPIALVNGNIRHYWTYYQEQFNHLDKDKNYFGQIRVHNDIDFCIIENGEKVFYRKIDEYEDSEGKKYNAFKYLNPRHDCYWSIDCLEQYKDKEFLYFEPDIEVETNWNYFGKKQFYPPVPIEVNTYFLRYPKMLEVVDYCFRKQPLTPELEKVFEEYDDYKCQEAECWSSPESLLITQVKPMLEQKAKEEEEARIMSEINRETELFKRELIRVRLKR